MNKKLRKLAKSKAGKEFIKYLEDKIKNTVADVRSPINVNPEIENDVRRGICQFLEEEIINPIKRVDNKKKAPDVDEWT